jgi:opacity protein-like surface antigen
MKRILAASVFAVLLAPAAVTQTAPAGQWSGTVVQNIGSSGYSVLMTITATGASTDYPELSCGGRLTPVGLAGEYRFYTETITRGRIDQGGRCIDGMIIVAPAEDKLAWGWFGSYKGKAYVAPSTLTRR